MPRTNLGRNIANEKIVALIWGTAAAAGLTTEELGAKAKISRSRIYARKNKPEDLTLRELRSIGRALNIPIDELREAIRYYSRFLACLLQCAGVADYSTFTVNGAKTALRINSGTIPVLGTVDVTTY